MSATYFQIKEKEKGKGEEEGGRRRGRRGGGVRREGEGKCGKMLTTV